MQERERDRAVWGNYSCDSFTHRQWGERGKTKRHEGRGEGRGGEKLGPAELGLLVLVVG